jgi:hypothetical protein
MLQSPIEAISAIAHRLGTLTDDLVFLGGAVVPLLVTDPAAPSPRVTNDVDAIVEVATRRDYWALERALRQRGFAQDEVDGVVCRWVIDGMKLDVMPTDEQILGFSNRWYVGAARTGIQHRIGTAAIRVVTAPYFLATKLEAFGSRGGGDFWASADIQDIVAVTDGRSELVEDMQRAPSDVRAYVAERIELWLHEDRVADMVAGHLLPDDASQARASLVIDRFAAIAAQAAGA